MVPILLMVNIKLLLLEGIVL